MRTIKDTISDLPLLREDTLPPPSYTGWRLGSPPENSRLGLAVESMRRHMTDEGWQIFAGLESCGYSLAGYNLPVGFTDVSKILYHVKPYTVVLQDKREWTGMTAGKGFDFRERFTRVDSLKERDDIFKLTILKDAQHNRPFHRESAEEIGCHAWIIYYHPTIVKRLAPYVRQEHLVRTYHSVDCSVVPQYTTNRRGVILSGAISDVYPMRKALAQRLHLLPETAHLKHPGYHRNGCCTSEFLRSLSCYKVAICTSSIYGYALRKIIEATACGCMVLTDLPNDEVLPHIDENLVRVRPDLPPKKIAEVLKSMISSYNPERQSTLAIKACIWYDYHMVGKRLADDIEQLRSHYELHGP